MGQVANWFAGPTSIWAEDPYGRYQQRLWTQDGWTNVVRDSPTSAGVIDSMADGDQEGWPPPAEVQSSRRRRRVLTAGGVLALVAAAVATVVRSDGQLTAAGPAAPPTAGLRTGTVGGMTQVPLKRVVERTIAGPVTQRFPDGSHKVSPPLTEDDFEHIVKDAVTYRPTARVRPAAFRH